VIYEVIDEKAPDYQPEPNTQERLAESDLEQIVRLSGFPSEPQLTKIPIPFKVVEYLGRQYKVRAYTSGEAAQRCLDLIATVEHLFTPDYRRLDRYLVFEYIKGSTVDSNEPAVREQILVGIPYFLDELATVQINDPLEDDFDFLCGNIGSAGIFRPRTMEVIRRYYFQVQSLTITSGLEYYDAMPRNFALTEEGKLVSIDEKHLRIGPRGVSLIKPLEQLSKADFAKLKEAYLSKLDRVPFDDPAYHEFLRFYQDMTVLGAVASYRRREVNMYSYSFHSSRRAVLGIVGASPATRLSEEALWLPFWVHQIKSPFQRTPGFLKRRLARIMARAGKRA
jgi:hypothetical protein